MLFRSVFVDLADNVFCQLYRLDDIVEIGCLDAGVGITERYFNVDTGDAVSFKLHIGQFGESADACNSLQVDACLFCTFFLEPDQAWVRLGAVERASAMEVV